MDWNEITNGIDRIAGKHITLSTDQVMKVILTVKLVLKRQLQLKFYQKHFRF